MEFSDRLLKRQVLARQYLFVETLAVMEVNCKLPSSLGYVYRPGVYRPGIGNRRFAIVIKTNVQEMYSLGMHSVLL